MIVPAWPPRAPAAAEASRQQRLCRACNEAVVPALCRPTSHILEDITLRHEAIRLIIRPLTFNPATAAAQALCAVCSQIELLFGSNLTWRQERGLIIDGSSISTPDCEHELPSWFACQLMHPPSKMARIRRLQALMYATKIQFSSPPSRGCHTLRASAPPFPDLIFLINLN